MTNETTPVPHATVKSSCSLPTTFIFILVIGMAGFATYTHWSLKQTSRQLTADLLKIKQDHLKTLHILQATQSLIETNHTTLQTDIDTLHNQFYAATTPSTDISHHWLLLKAQYALELAQFNAQWSEDKTTTIALLKQADGFLAENNNPELIPVRQTLANEILVEENASTTDVTGLLSQLNAIQHYIATCPYNKSIAKQENTLSRPTATPAPLTMRARIHASLKTLKTFFIVHHHTDPLQPILTPAYKKLQKEIIRLNIQEAEWAILQRNNTVYQLSLQQACDNIRHAFGKGNMKAEQIIQQLEHLQLIQIQETNPIPKESLTALLKIINHQSTGKTPTPPASPNQEQHIPFSYGVTP